MKYRRLHRGRAFPRYDDAAHIDSAAVAPTPPPPEGADPAATAYTERYCGPDAPHD